MTSTVKRLNRDFLRFGRKGLHHESSPVEYASAPVEELSKSKERRSRSKANQSHQITIDNSFVENEERDKTHIRRIPIIGRLRRMWLKLRNFWTTKLTSDELELREKQLYNARVLKASILDMRTANQRMVNALAALNFEYVRKGRGKNERERIQRVHFACWKISDRGNRIYGKVDRIPHGIYAYDMIQERVLIDLGARVGHPVGGRVDDNGNGVMFWIDLAGRNDFVDKIFWRDMLNKVPKTALPLTFIVGSTKNGGREWRNLESSPHFIAGGESGGGKTNFMHTMICTFISRNSPKNVQLAMIDLKFGGVALNRYKGIPHLVSILSDDENLPSVPTGIANDIPSAITILKWALAESNRRGHMFLTDHKHNPEKIEEWNKYHIKDHLPRVVIFIDELALCMDKSDIDSKEELALIKQSRMYIKSLLRLARSSGVHVCGFTQSLNKDIMGVAFKTNIKIRLAFSGSDPISSVLMVNDGSAINLPVGRAIYKSASDKFMVQTPQIFEADIAECVKNAITGKISAEITSKAITPEDIIHWSVEEGNYSLNRDMLYQHFKGEISFNQLDKTILPSMENNTYEVDGEKYKVVPGRGTLSRRVERLNK